MKGPCLQCRFACARNLHRADGKLKANFAQSGFRAGPSNGIIFWKLAAEGQVQLCLLSYTLPRPHGCLQPKPTHPQLWPDHRSALCLRGQVHAGPSPVQTEQSGIVVEIYPTQRPSFVFCSFARRASHPVTLHGALQPITLRSRFLPELISRGFWHLPSWSNTFCGGALVRCLRRGRSTQAAFCGVCPAPELDALDLAGRAEAEAAIALLMPSHVLLCCREYGYLCG